ncbi:hypothetical protein D3C81_2191960 [compost metagenome]
MRFVAVAVGFGGFFEIVIVVNRRRRHIEAKQRHEHQSKTQYVKILKPVQGVQRSH